EEASPAPRQKLHGLEAGQHPVRLEPLGQVGDAAADRPRLVQVRLPTLRGDQPAPGEQLQKLLWGGGCRCHLRPWSPRRVPEHGTASLRLCVSPGWLALRTFATGYNERKGGT